MWVQVVACRCSNRLPVLPCFSHPLLVLSVNLHTLPIHHAQVPEAILLKPNMCLPGEWGGHGEYEARGGGRWSHNRERGKEYSPCISWLAPCRRCINAD